METFDPSDPINNISLYSFANPVRFILGVGLIFWLSDYGWKVINSKGMAQTIQAFTHSFLPIILILIFLSNQGVYSRVLAYGLRDTVNSWSEGALNQQIAGQTLRSALSEQLLAEEVKNQIREQAQKCLQMPRPQVILPSATRPTPAPNNPLTSEQEQAYNYLECLERLVAFIEQKQNQVLQSQACTGGCAFVRAILEGLAIAAGGSLAGEVSLRTGETVDTVIDNPDAFTETSRDLVDFLSGLEQQSFMYVFSFIQWMWISFLELSMWLLGLFAPLFVALSIIPGRQNMFMFWVIEFLTIGLAKLAYVFVIGVVAIQLTEAQSLILSSDGRFFGALGLFAPGVSFAIVTVGGIAAASSFRGQSVGAISTIAGVAIGSVATIAYSLSRYSDRRR